MDKANKLVREIEDVRWGLVCFVYHPAKGLLVIDGYLERRRGKERGKRAIRVYDVATGRILHSWPSELRLSVESLSVDPSGAILAFFSKEDKDHDGGTIVELPSGRLLEQREPNMERFPQTMSTQLEHWIANPGATFWRRQENRPLARLDLDADANSRNPLMTPDGRFVAWGNSDGTGNVCDMEKIREKLNEVDMGW